MLIKKIYLQNFRNFEKVSHELSTNLTLIIGENARGKTTLLEGVYTSVYGTGFRESREVELLKWDEDQSMVEGEFVEKKVRTLFQIRFQKDSEISIKKSFYVNKTTKSPNDYRASQTQAVLFAPQHIEIITGSPSHRREYFDIVLSSFDLEYKKKLRDYESALRKRNKLLEIYRTEEKLWEEISFWNNYMMEQAAYVTGKRQKYIDYLNENQHVDGKTFSIEYLKDEFTKERIFSVFAQEMAMRRTVIGPQKDDMCISLHDPIEKSVHLYGSRSEQRMAVFWLKINELKYFETFTKYKPILLLDDIFSELDHHNRELVMSMIGEYQTIATTTEEEVKNLAHIPEKIIHL